jgi:hypothetical protein
MKAIEFLKTHRIYEDDVIYNSVGEMSGTITQLMEEYALLSQPCSVGTVIPRISHFVSKIGKKYHANDEAVSIEIQDGYLKFYEIGYDFERIYLTPIYVA